MRKKVDERIRTLIENGVKQRHRSMFVIIGDKSRDQACSVSADELMFEAVRVACRVIQFSWLRCRSDAVFFVVVFVQIVNLHYMLSKAVVKTRPTVLWCYKDKLELSRFLFIYLTFLINLVEITDIGFIWELYLFG